MTYGVESDITQEHNVFKAKIKRQLRDNDRNSNLNPNRLLLDTDVGCGFRTAFIQTGYREPGLSIKDCLVSLTRPTNETINVWSHVIALGLFGVRFFNVFTKTTHEREIWCYPLLCFAAGIAALLAMSSIAHLCNCISLKAHHVGFYLDYAAISVYSFSASQAFFYYSRPANSSLPLFQSPAVFMSVSALMSFLCTAVCCASRHRWTNSRYVIRTALFIVYFTIVTFPFSYRVATTTDNRGDEAVQYFARHIIIYIFSAIVNMTKIPERYFPKVFDFFGQSHHFLHVLAALGASDAFSAVSIDMKDRYYLFDQNQKPNLLNSCGFFVLVAVVNLIIVVGFAKALFRSKHEKQK